MARRGEAWHGEARQGRHRKPERRKNMVYKWRTYDRCVPAQDVGDHIEELDKQFGEVTPQILLDDARPDKALLHPLYEWRDDVAAEKYRLGQSREIMSELVLVCVANEPVQVSAPVRAFVSVSDLKEKARYRPVVTVMSEEETRQQVIKNALAELDAFKRKYDGLVDFASLVKEWLDKQ